ncbi:hypothetical protein [Amaricoccus tamworthensis]|uniref:hypothetical protein n=1 Tax=Amaricoccus tamworthensis TaxID=57002 RepID=UPI003C7AEC81
MSANGNTAQVHRASPDRPEMIEMLMGDGTVGWFNLEWFFDRLERQEWRGVWW